MIVLVVEVDDGLVAFIDLERDAPVLGNDEVPCASSVTDS
jgi:hypothetical protein